MLLPRGQTGAQPRAASTYEVQPAAELSVYEQLAAIYSSLHLRHARLMLLSVRPSVYVLSSSSFPMPRSKNAVGPSCNPTDSLSRLGDPIRRNPSGGSPSCSSAKEMQGFADRWTNYNEYVRKDAEFSLIETSMRRLTLGVLPRDPNGHFLSTLTRDARQSSLAA